MSNLKASDVNGLLEAYTAVYDHDLREELEEEREVEEVGLQIIENAAYVLFSQGYTVNDLIDYFSEADSEVITEDAIAISEGVLLVESVAVSDEYIAEQFEILYEGIIDTGLKLIGKGAQFAGKALTGGGKKAEALGRLQTIKNIKNAKNAVPAVPPGSAKVTQGVGGLKPPTGTAKVTTSGGGTIGRNLFQKAGDWAKGVMKKIPGAGTAAKLAKGPIGKIAGKALPGVGAALYGADAVSRFKKGDWGGGLLSGAGAVTSLIPGGPIGALAPAAIQMATDAAGLTGDKSKKGPKIVGPKKVGPKIVGPKQPRAQTPAAPTPSRAPSAPPAAAPPAAPSTPPRSGKPPTAKPAPTKAAPAPTGAPMQQWAAKFPHLASKVTSGQSGYDEISQMRDKPGPNERQDQTPTQGPTPSASQQSQLNKTGYAAPESSSTNAQSTTNNAEQERKKREKQGATTTSESYDAFGLVLEYLTVEGHVDTLDEAFYVMMEMDSETIQSICEAKYGTAKGRKRLAKKVRAGKNIGKKGPGTGFAAVEKAAEAGGASDPKAVAAAAMWKTYGGKK